MPVPDFFALPGFSGSGTELKCFLVFFMLFVLQGRINAQWVNDPAENTRVVYDLNDPVNISAVGDMNGGTFIVWEDNMTGLQNEISFMHVEPNGSISFRADGINISQSTGDQKNPQIVAAGKNNAVIAWKDFAMNKNGNLFVQKVQANGITLWNSGGIKVNKTNDRIIDYSMCADRAGEVYISYLAEEPGNSFNSRIILQKISPDGIFVYDSLGTTVSGSENGKMLPCVLSDDSSGCYVCWIETLGSKGIILSQHYNKSGRPFWGTKPLNITDNSLNIITYTAAISKAGLYLAYQVMRKDKSIYHQFISYNGKLSWGKNGKLCSNQKGSQSNPQIFADDAGLILSWTNEFNNDRDICVQRFDRNSKPVWQNNGINVTNMKGDQFGQKIISDKRNGAIIAWIDRRTSSAAGIIYAQRITSEGKIYWDSSGVAIGSFFNSPKSYLNLLSDGRGSAIAVFKEKRNRENGIYAQKIFNTGTFVSQMIGFKSDVAADSIKIQWYSANEFPNSTYTIERSMQTDSGNTDWEEITSVSSVSGKASNYYQYYDKPDTSGIFYYQVTLDDNRGNTQTSEISRVNFIESANYIIVAQNEPNPFSDSTQIKFYLPGESDVKIEFFDNHIEKIDELNRTFPAGENSVTFSAKDRNPGIYFYKFECGDFVEVKKMVLTY